jgi:hypothetical protein
LTKSAWVTDTGIRVNNLLSECLVQETINNGSSNHLYISNLCGVVPAILFD